MRMHIRPPNYGVGKPPSVIATYLRFGIIENLTEITKPGEGCACSVRREGELSHAEAQRAQRRRLGAKRLHPDCPIGFRLPGVLSEVAGRTSPRHSVVEDRSYSWLRYTVTISISLKS